MEVPGQVLGPEQTYNPAASPLQALGGSQGSGNMLKLPKDAEGEFLGLPALDPCCFLGWDHKVQLSAVVEGVATG